MRRRIAPLAAIGLLMLASLDGWLSLLVLGGMLYDAAPDVPKGEWHPQLPTSGDDDAAPKPLEGYPLTVAQPVFFKTRAPFVTPPPAPPPPPPKVAQPAPPAPADAGLVLGGVMTNGDLRKAYLLTKTNPAGSWVAEGENFMGWTLNSIGSSSAKVQQQDRTIELQLYPPTSN
jgi:hypothetical protein